MGLRAVQWVRIGRQFCRNLPCVMRVALNEARRSMEPESAVIIDLTKHQHPAHGRKVLTASNDS